MCGIAGIILDRKPIKSTSLHNSNIRIMTDSISHRGPDSEGFYIDDNNGVYFGHRRLSIQDLSSNGSQPMVSACQNFIMVFNGEIFNHLRLRQEINQTNWKSASDTETLLEYFAKHGIEKTLASIHGQFAFSIFDKRTRKLYFARDRFGEKPLFIYKSRDAFIFGSELNSMKNNPHFSLEIDSASLQEFFKYGFIPSNKTIYKNVYKLEPGCWGLLDEGSIKVSKYFNPKSLQMAQLNYKDNTDLIGNTEQKLEEVILKQMIADVPIGTFLSGGVDSSLISYFVQKNSSSKIDTFTVAFKDEFDESPVAKAVAKKIGCKNYTIDFYGRNLRKYIDDFSGAYDEPFADESSIPLVALSNFAKKKVKVCMTGDGGDEMFYGYRRYSWENYINSIRKLPKFLKNLASPSILALGNIAEELKNTKLEKNKYEKFRNAISKKDHQTSYLSLLSGHNYGVEQLFYEPPDTSIYHDKYADFREYDLNFYLPYDILVKSDRASMSQSLELRAPFLDPDIFSFVRSLPKSAVIKEPKWLLKEVLFSKLPKNLFLKEKSGFSAPTGLWLNHELKEEALELFSLSNLEKIGFLNSKKINQLLIKHQNTSNKSNKLLWNIYIFLKWNSK